MPVLNHGLLPISQRLHLWLLPEAAVGAEALHLLHEGNVTSVTGGAGGVLCSAPLAARLDSGLDSLAGPPHAVGRWLRRLTGRGGRTGIDGAGDTR